MSTQWTHGLFYLINDFCRLGRGGMNATGEKRHSDANYYWLFLLLIPLALFAQVAPIAPCHAAAVVIAVHRSPALPYSRASKYFMKNVSTESNLFVTFIRDVINRLCIIMLW